ncbi:hypothetical protein [Sporosarcina globispora]|nr:hypothetical protein [Sporosarcina globispora]
MIYEQQAFIFIMKFRLILKAAYIIIRMKLEKASQHGMLFQVYMK